MQDPNQPTIFGCLKYSWENFSTAIQFKKKTASVLAAAAIIVGLVLAGLQSSGKLPVVWSNSQLAFCAEMAAVFLGALHFLFWRPYTREMESRSEIQNLQQAIADRESTLVEGNRPKLEFECATAINGCSVISEASFRHYFRAKVTLRCHQAVSGCFARLVQIQRASDNHVIRNHEIDRLPFAPSRAPDSLSKTLSPEVPEFLDVLIVDFRLGVNRVLIAAENDGAKPAMTVENTYGFNTFEKYFLTLMTGGAGIPTQTVRLLFDWTGDHRTSTLVLL